MASKKQPKSTDALDHRAFRKGGFSKAEKRAYAKEKHMEDLMQPPKAPLAAWLDDASLLPRKPPGREHEPVDLPTPAPKKVAKTWTPPSFPTPMPEADPAEDAPSDEEFADRCARRIREILGK